MDAKSTLGICVYCTVAFGLTMTIPHDIPAEATLPPQQMNSAPLSQPNDQPQAPPARALEQVGLASWYGPDHQGRRTASGARFDWRKLTAAHPTLPLNSKAKITNLENGRSVIVTVNDRGPGLPYRAIDLSERAAQRLHMKKEGLATVKIEPVTPQSSQIALK